MAQFDVCRNTGTTRGRSPFLLILQSTLFKGFDRRVVIPMTLRSVLPRDIDSKLCPPFVVEGQVVLLMPLEITNIPAERLGPVVMSLRDEAETVIAAVDWMMNRGWD